MGWGHIPPLPFRFRTEILSDALAIEKGVTLPGLKTLSFDRSSRRDQAIIRPSCWLLFVWETFVS